MLLFKFLKFAFEFCDKYVLSWKWCEKIIQLKNDEQKMKLKSSRLLWHCYIVQIIVVYLKLSFNFIKQNINL